MAQLSQLLQGGTRVVMAKVCVPPHVQPKQFELSTYLHMRTCFSCWPHLYLSRYQQQEIFMTLTKIFPLIYLQKHANNSFLSPSVSLNVLALLRMCFISRVAVRPLDKHQENDIPTISKNNLLGFLK